MKAIVLAAGKSPKLAPFSDTRPKSMLFLSGQFILETILLQLKEAGVQEVWLVVGHKREIIQNVFSYGKGLGIKIDYLVQEEPEGIGHALSLCEKVIGEDSHFMLVYGDALMSGNAFVHLLKRFERDKTQALATITHPASEGAYGNIYLTHDMKISKFVEKPEGHRMSNYIFGGSFMLSRQVFGDLGRLKLDLVALFQELISKNGMEASLWEDNWIDVSRPWHILSANQMMMKPWTASSIPQSCRIASNVNIHGVVRMGENVTISSGTTLQGPCYIGDNSFLGNNCLIRQNSSIGPGSEIGYGTEIKNAVLFGKNTVGRLAFIGDSVLGKEVNFGSGTMTINYDHLGRAISVRTPEGELATGLTKLGAFIGDGTVIGAGHNIGPGTLIPPGRIIADQITITQNHLK